MLEKMLVKNCIKLNLKSKNKADVIDELVDVLYANGRLNNKEEFKKTILKREEQSSTGLEEGIAIPHGKSESVKIPTVAFGLSKDGIDYDSLDGEPSKLFFMIAAPANATDSHIETLSQLSSLLLDDDIREQLLQVKTEQEVLDILLKEEKVGETLVSSENKTFDVLAVTACPTGIAHTYMAAEALNKKAKEMGINIKVETNGSTGVKNEITQEDIKNAKGIIIAADKNVEMSRFNGKHVEIVGVKDGIKRPQELIQNALDQKAPIYSSKETSKQSSGSERKGFYKHLMSGVSNMLPFVVGGGILIAISFIFGIKASDPTDPSFNPIAKLLMDIGGGNAFFLMIPVLAGFIGMSIADRPGFAPAMVGGLISANNGGGFLGGLVGGFLGGYVVLLLKKLFAKLPEKLEGIKPVLLYPLFGILITGVLMYLVVISPVAALNSGITNFLNGLGTGNLILLGAIVGGMMAIDMGGPINKAAFTFGIAAIAAGNYYPHAAVMAGGMTPPLGIALATTFFKHKFDKEEREAGLTNYIMGASFITEGAIPFAAADPIRVIPSCIAGSALAGGLAMAFKCQLPAPHGGLFVLPIITNPLMYLFAVAAGSLVTCVLIGLTKPSKTI
ncbi:PTS sugar transporter subunit IIA [Cetobacterium sp. 8H]|uniref:PTS fructose transporter subunit IIABC n=1 Tax=Cetobacterium sp. 8H TaxID=2759681 RepID=UPI00163C22FF|nr:fructose-specific PTS transporter subunit EIIC [Cetobacterium sp. 8H]MBC2850736.1 PTS sugar transporter subunit IIA [Cetobacterium sp. 8H]